MVRSDLVELCSGYETHICVRPASKNTATIIVTSFTNYHYLHHQNWAIALLVSFFIAGGRLGSAGGFCGGGGG